MKKILSVSILAMLAVAPLAANADPVVTTGHYNGQKVSVGTNATADADKGIAAVGYVKGAYNAAVEVVNQEYDRATDAEDALSTRIGTLSANGNYMDKDASVSANLAALDGRIKTNTDHIGTWTNLNNSGALANGNNADLVTAVNALNTALGTAGSESTVGSGYNYIGSSHFADTDPNSTADDNTVANNLGALDTQVKANEDAITILNGADTNSNSVLGRIKNNAKDASFATSHTTSGTSVLSSAQTISGAIDTLDSEIVKLEGGVGVTGSVSKKIYDEAQNAEFTKTNTTEGSSNFTSGEDTITEAINTLDTAVMSLKGSNGTIATQIKEQAAGADFTSTTGTGKANLTSTSLGAAINETASRQVLVYTSWGADGTPGGAQEVALVDPGAAATINNSGV